MIVVPRRVDPLSNHQLVWHSVLFELPLAINNRAGVVKSKDVPYHQHRFCEERETSCDRDIQVSVLRVSENTLKGRRRKDFGRSTTPDLQSSKRTRRI